MGCNTATGAAIQISAKKHCEVPCCECSEGRDFGVEV
jgi:hypothetical protein